MNKWSGFTYLAVRAAATLGVLSILGMVTIVLIAFAALFWELISPIIEHFGLATIVLIPITGGILYSGWKLAGFIMGWISREYGT